MNTKEFAEKFIKAEDEAVQKGNFEPLKALEDPDVVYHMSAFGDLIGHEGHKQNLMDGRQAFSDIKMEWQYLTGEGNLFALSLKERLISSGKMPGMPPADTEIITNSLFLFRLKHSRIIEAWNNGSWKGVDIEAFVKTLKK